MNFKFSDIYKLFSSTSNVAKKIEEPKVITQGTIENYGTFYIIGGSTLESKLNKISELEAEVASAEDIAHARLHFEDDFIKYIKHPINYYGGMVNDKILRIPKNITHKDDLTILIKNCKYDDATLKSLKPANNNPNTVTIEKFFKEHIENVDYYIVKDNDLGPTNIETVTGTKRLLFGEDARDYVTLLKKIGINMGTIYLFDEVNKEITLKNLYMNNTLDSKVDIIIDAKFVDKEYDNEHNVLIQERDNYDSSNVFAIKRFKK
ncbi:MAG: hypothetical protein ACP5N1_02645 [Candidatus Woesearchaeota archaeon]